IKNFIKHNTPTRPNLKSELLSLQEKERQRLESLRRKQEAEEQRSKKVEEEKKRRQAEMKQKREERLRKALQARERVEQMEEEKKKRMEQKILQNDDKVRVSQVREEKGAEERSRRKLLKKPGEADTWKQKMPKEVRAALGPSWLFCLLQEEDELEQQEALQKRREDGGKEKGHKVLELRNLVEQQQVEQAKERYWLGDHKQRGKEKAPQPQLEAAAIAEENIKVVSRSGGGWSAEAPAAAERGEENQAARSIGRCLWHVAEQDCEVPDPVSRSDVYSLCSQEAIPTPCLVSPKGTEESRSPEVNENNYGMDLNSDDSTDDENDPRKPVPAWAHGSQLNQTVLHQYYHPLNVDQIFGLIPSPKLEDIFGKTKPRYFKRTSSAVWHSPP
ncbi:INCE protein, partial [Thinocorus orbignyianus]|nr:INCE protein [Thinocorus orbignyianus]